MMGKTHLAGGIACGCAAAMAYPTVGTKAAVIIMGAVGGLVPDIDHKNSKLSHKLPVLSWIARLFSGHRGLFHCPMFYAALYILIWLLPIQNLLVAAGINGLFLGICSHLLLDACTVNGIPLLFPVSQKNIHLLKIRTNSGAELLVRVALIILTGYLLALLFIRPLLLKIL